MDAEKRIERHLRDLEYHTRPQERANRKTDENKKKKERRSNLDDFQAGV